MERERLHDEEVKDLLATSKIIAIVGAKDSVGQPVDRVGRYLLQAGYTLIPVHPKRKTVWGIAAVPTLRDVEGADIVVLFRAPAYCGEHAKEFLTLAPRPRCFWMQEDIRSEEARTLLQDKALVVEDACIMIEHARLFHREEHIIPDPKKTERKEIIAPVDDSSVFDCKMCGQCCKGQGGIVVSPGDLERILRALNMNEADFRAQYGEIRDGKLQIRTGDDGACIFFREGKGCAVHAGKPDVCRAWPFFRGNIIDPYSLELAKDYCPGISKDCDHATFAKEGREYLRKHKLLGHDVDKDGRAVIL